MVILRAVVVRDDKEKLKDLGDVLKIARALGKQVFRTAENVRVVRIFGPDAEIGGYVVVLEGPATSKPTGLKLDRRL